MGKVLARVSKRMIVHTEKWRGEAGERGERGEMGEMWGWPKRANCVHCISSVVKCHKLIRRKCFVSARDCV